MAIRRDAVDKILRSLEKDTVFDKNIDAEVQQSFLDYAMSVITSRALPDIKDGLKPVHRRIIYAAYQEKLTSDAKFKKSAALVGAVMGSYHPHGDSSIYDALVRMAQDFSLRYPLIEGQGNFGSIDGDAPAAMRYTEARLTKIGEYFLEGIEEDSVDFMDNYDQSKKEPIVLPTLIPNVLINGSTGIAVGLATNIPPHNLSEILDAILALVKNPEMTTDELFNYIKGPDFPTGGTVYQYSGVKNYFEKGKGTFRVRSKIDVEEEGNKNLLIIKEIPYGIKKTRIIERIVTLIKPTKSGITLNSLLANSITDIRDESSLDVGIRLIIECNPGISPQAIINNLYKYTQLQAHYSPNITVLVNGEPKVVSLLELLKIYLHHQMEMLVRRTTFQLGVLNKRIHILEGREKISSDVLEAVKLINTSDEPEKDLKEKYDLSDEQVEDIFKLTIGRLKKISIENLKKELLEKNEDKLLKESILASEEKQKEVFSNAILSIKEKFGDDRKTIISANDYWKITKSDLHHFKKIVLFLSNKGYLSQMDLDTFQLRKKGSAGISGVNLHKGDVPKMLIACYSKDFILFFTNLGRVYRIEAYEMNLDGDTKGRIVYNILTSMDKSEKVINILALKSSDYSKKDMYLLFATKQGLIKKCHVGHFSKVNANGKIAIVLNEEDELKFVIKVDNSCDICLASSIGRMVRFPSNQCRPLGRTSKGYYGIHIEKGFELVSASSTMEGNYVLSISEKGIGKLTHVDKFKRVFRGKKKGMKAQNIVLDSSDSRYQIFLNYKRKHPKDTDGEGEESLDTVKSKDGSKSVTGALLACVLINKEDELLLMSSTNKINRTNVKRINEYSRVSKGVKLFDLKGDSDKNVQIVSYSKISYSEIEELYLEDDMNKDTVEGATKEISFGDEVKEEFMEDNREESGFDEQQLDDDLDEEENDDIEDTDGEGE